MKRLGTLARFMASSFGTTLVDFGLFTLIFHVLKGYSPIYAEIIATVVARICSSLLNFYFNRRLVFKNTGSMKTAMLRYYCLAVPQMLASAGLVTLINELLRNSETFITTGVKGVVDVTLFFISYFIQKKWVFKKPEEGKAAHTE